MAGGATRQPPWGVPDPTARPESDPYNQAAVPSPNAMRALFLIPGMAARQLQTFPAVAAVAEQLQAAVQVVCPPETAVWWGLHPAVEKTIPFPFASATLADWANLLGSVREPDFQLCINLAQGRPVDLMLAMSHIPTRVATAGFSATERVLPSGGWPNQALAAYLRPLGVSLNAEAYRLALPQAELQAAAAQAPAGGGPLLLLAPAVSGAGAASSGAASSGAAGPAADWPAERWQELPGRIRSRLADLRVIEAGAAATSPRQRAAQLASADVVLASDPLSIELALLLGQPLVALGRAAASLPSRAGVQGLGEPGQLAAVSTDAVLAALGLA